MSSLQSPVKNVVTSNEEDTMLITDLPNGSELEDNTQSLARNSVDDRMIKNNKDLREF